MLSIRKIGSIGRTYRYLGRYQEILRVLAKYGFDDVVDSLNIREHVEIGRQKIFGKQPEQIEKLTRAERVRLTLEELGPTFVKWRRYKSKKKSTRKNKQ